MIDLGGDIFCINNNLSFNNSNYKNNFQEIQDIFQDQQNKTNVLLEQETETSRDQAEIKMKFS
jgi:hypothetical protein